MRHPRNRWVMLGASGAAGLMLAPPALGEEPVRHTVVVEELSASDEAALASQENSEQFKRFFRFGMVDMSILLLSLVAGVSLDGVIARYIGVQGYGAIVGAGVGNVVADVVAGMPEGLYSALGVGAGSLLPLTPLAVPMLMKKPMNRPISIAVGAASVGFCALAFTWGHLARKEKNALLEEERTHHTHHVHVVREVDGDAVQQLEIERRKQTLAKV